MHREFTYITRLKPDFTTKAELTATSAVLESSTTSTAVLSIVHQRPPGCLLAMQSVFSEACQITTLPQRLSAHNTAHRSTSIQIYKPSLMSPHCFLSSSSQPHIHYNSLSSRTQLFKLTEFSSFLTITPTTTMQSHHSSKSATAAPRPSQMGTHLEVPDQSVCPASGAPIVGISGISAREQAAGAGYRQSGAHLDGARSSQSNMPLSAAGLQARSAQRTSNAPRSEAARAYAAAPASHHSDAARTYHTGASRALTHQPFSSARACVLL
jgi:hypothetical protein